MKRRTTATTKIPNSSAIVVFLPSRSMTKMVKKIPVEEYQILITEATAVMEKEFAGKVIKYCIFKHC